MSKPLDPAEKARRAEAQAAARRIKAAAKREERRGELRNACQAFRSYTTSMARALSLASYQATIDGLKVVSELAAALCAAGHKLRLCAPKHVDPVAAANGLCDRVLASDFVWPEQKQVEGGAS